jgi:hypothetical protein
MDEWLFFLGGMTICCAILCPLSAFSDWLQGKLDEWNEYNDEQQQLNEQEQ